MNRSSSHRNKTPLTFWLYMHEYTYVCMYVCMYVWYDMIWYDMIWYGVEWNTLLLSLLYILHLPFYEWINWSNAVHLLLNDSSVGKLYTFASFIRNNVCFFTIPFMSTYTHMYVYMYVCIFVCMYIYKWYWIFSHHWSKIYQNE